MNNKKQDIINDIAIDLSDGIKIENQLEEIEKRVYKNLGHNLEMISILQGGEGLENLVTQINGMIPQVKDQWEKAENYKKENIKKIRTTLDVFSR